MLVLLAVICLAIMIGNELCVAVFVNPLLRKLPEAEQVPFLAPAASRLGRVMPVWYAASLILSAAAAYECWGGSGIFAMPIWSVALQLLIIVLTVVKLVPLNNRLGKLQAGETGWTSIAVQWDRLHQLRILLLVVALALLASPFVATFVIFPFR